MGRGWWEPGPAGGRAVPRAARGLEAWGGRPPFWSRPRSACQVEPVWGGRGGGRTAEEGLGRAALHRRRGSLGPLKVTLSSAAWEMGSTSPSGRAFSFLSCISLRQNKIMRKLLIPRKVKRTVSVTLFFFFFCYSETGFGRPWSGPRLQMNNFSC